MPELDLKTTLWFVRGACAERNDREPGFTDDLLQYSLRVHGTVWAFLKGQRSLDASCDDFTCTVAHEAARIWGWPGQHIKG